ncbi:MAG: hypothetical protein ACKOC7_01605, partial [Sphingomonadales bacterium]
MVLLCGIFLLLKTPAVQSWLGKKVAGVLSNRLATQIAVDRVSFSLLDRFSLQGLLVLDRQQDTIAYAQKLELRLTDWFFVKDSIDLTHVQLNHAFVRLYRSDSTWRHQFIIDYFSGGPSDSSQPEKKTVAVHLHHLSLRSIRFERTDRWEGDSLHARLEKLELEADRLSTESKPIRIRSLLIDHPQLNWTQFAALKAPSNGNNKKASSTSDSPAQNSFLSTNLPHLQLARVEIRKGSFRVSKQGRKLVPGIFDAAQPAIDEMDLLLRNTALNGDTLQSTLTLNAKERSGFAIKKLQSKVEWMPGSISLDSFYLQTNHSVIKQRTHLRFPISTPQPSLAKDPRLETQITYSLISSKDIAFFYPAAAAFNKDVQVKARISGNADNLNINDLLLQAGTKSFLQGELQLRNVRDPQKREFNLQAKRLNTSYEDLVFFIPALVKQKNRPLSQVRYLRFQGSLTGQQQQFTANGNWQTGLGAISTKLSVKLPANRSPEYEGAVELTAFDLGALSGVPSLGRIDFKGKTQGRGLQWSDATSTFEGSLGAVEYNNYTYRNIRIEGSLQDQLLRIKTRIQDEHLLAGPLEATWHAGNNLTSLQVAGVVEKASLKELRLSTKDIQLSGQIESDIRYSNNNEVEATLAFRNAAISVQEELLPLDSLIVQVSNTAAQKSISVLSNEFSAHLKGQYQLNEIGLIGQHFLARYYPSQFTIPSSLAPDTRLNFSVQTSLAGPFLTALAPGWSGLNYSSIEGSWSAADNNFSLQATIPELRYEQYKADRIVITSAAANDRLHLEGSVSQFTFNDTVSLPPVTLQFSASNDSSRIQLRSGKGSGVEKLNLNALVTTFKDGFALHWDPSDFTINGKLWTLGEEGELVLRKNSPVSGNLFLYEGEQQVRLRTMAKENDQKDRISLELSNINLNDVAPYVLPDNRLEGVVSGKLLIEDPVGDLRITSGPITTRLLRLDNDSIGELSAQLSFDQESGRLSAQGSTRNPQERLSFDLLLYTKDSLTEKNKITLNTQQYPIKLLERFLGDLFSDITGYLTGDIIIGGDLNRPAVTGKGRLSKAGLRVNYTQCYYSIEDKEIELTPTRIELNGLVLRDTVTQNP